MPFPSLNLSSQSIRDPITQRFIEASRKKVKSLAEQKRLELDMKHDRIYPTLGRIPSPDDSRAGFRAYRDDHRAFMETQDQVNLLSEARREAAYALDASDKAHRAAVQKPKASDKTHYTAVQAGNAGAFRYPWDVVKTYISDKAKGFEEALSYPYNVAKTFIAYQKKEVEVNKAFQDTLDQEQAIQLNRRRLILDLPEAPRQRNNRPANDIPAEEPVNHSIPWRIL